jgi:hypothetical protein
MKRQLNSLIKKMKQNPSIWKKKKTKKKKPKNKIKNLKKYKNVKEKTTRLKEKQTKQILKTH